MAFSPDDKILAVAGETTELLNARNGHLLANLIVFNSLPDELNGMQNKTMPEWMALTPDGFYTGSQDCEKYIRWRIGDELFPAAKFAAKFRRPDKVAAALANTAALPD